MASTLNPLEQCGYDTVVKTIVSRGLSKDRLPGRHRRRWTTGDGAAVIHIKDKGGQERGVPIEAELLSLIATYLASRAIRPLTV